MLLKIYQYLISRKILVYFVLLYSRDLSRLNVKEERANSFVVAESVTCTQAIDFSTLVAGNKKKKKKTREYAHIHEDAPHTGKNIDENSATVSKETTTKEERNEK